MFIEVVAEFTFVTVNTTVNTTQTVKGLVHKKGKII